MFQLLKYNHNHYIMYISLYILYTYMLIKRNNPKKM